MASTVPAGSTPKAAPAAPPADAPSGKTGAEGGFFGKESSLPGVADSTAEMPGADDVKSGAHPPQELESETAVDRVMRKREEAKKPKKTAKGKELPTEPEAEAPKIEKAAPKDVEPDKDGEFEFAGAKWRDAEHAEKSFRTLRGLFRQETQFGKQAQTLAFQWQAQHAQDTQILKTEITRLRSMLAAAGIGTEGEKVEKSAPGASADAAKKGVLGSIDWELFGRLQKEGPEWAAGYIADLMDTHLSQATAKIAADLRKEFEDRLGPFREDHSSRQFVQKASGFFEAQAQASDDDGQPLYPEFHLQKGESQDSPQAHRRIEKLVGDVGRYWVKLPAEVQFTPRGFRLAYLEYLDAKRKAPSEETEPGGPPEGDDLDALLGEAARARAALHGGTGTPRASGREPTAEDRSRSFAQAITAAGTRNARLGFTE